VIGFTPVFVNPGGNDSVASAFSSGACGAGNTPCFATIGAALANVAVAGVINIQAGTYAENPNFNQNCTTNIAGNVTLNGATLTNGTFNAGSFTTALAAGNWTNNGGVFTQATSTISFTGAAAQSIGGANQTTFNNLTINNASGVSLTNSETVGAALTLTNGALGVGTNTLTLNGAVSFASGSFTSSATGTVNYNQGSNGQGVAPGTYGNLTLSNFNKTLAATGMIGVAGTFTPGSAVGHTITNSTFDFNGAGAQTVPTFNYNNLTISGNRGGAAITLASGNIGIAGTFTPSATSNTYSTAGNTIIFNGGVTQTIPAFAFAGLSLNNASGANQGGDVTVGGALNLTSGAFGVGANTLTLNGAASAPGGSLTSGTAGTVNYNQQSNGQATVLAANYGNLTFSNFNKTLASSGTIGIAGTFTPGSGAAHTITGSTINFNGASPQTIPGFTYNNLTSSSGATARTLDSVNTIKIAAAFTPGTNVYTITGSTIEYNGSALQALPSSGFNTYNNLTLNNAAGTTGFAGLTVNGLIEVKAGTFTSSSTYNNVQIDSGATLAASAGSTINVSGSWTNNGGTFTPNTGTVNFNGSSAQSIGGLNGQTFNNLTNSNAAGLTMSFDNTVNGILALTSGDITVAATKTLTQPLAGSSSGTFDVIGAVKRTGGPFAAATLITFGNPNNQITFSAAGTKPTDMTVTLAKAAPATYTAAVQRNYLVAVTGGSGYTATFRLRYLDAEVSGFNAEPTLNLRRLRTSDSHWVAQLPDAVDTTNNFVEATLVPAANLPTQWTFSSQAPTASGATVTGRITDDHGMPVEGAVIRLQGSQNRKFITDANGYYRFDNVETSGFYTVTPSRVNYTFSPATRSFSQLGETTEATFGATMASSNLENPLDTPEYFVRQNYIDFLGREPDEAGFNFWSDQILECGTDQSCVDRRRENVSAAYFLSIEFQETGGLVDGLYRASYGVAPQYSAFMPDARTVGLGVRVGDDGWQAKLAANKEAFVNSFANRPAFHQLYDSMDNSLFVDTLIQHTGVSFTATERDALVSGLGTGTMTRGEALRSIAENQSFINAKFNQAFVMMEYFGYLRRDPDSSGYEFWLNKLNEFGGNFEQADMVKAFIVSGEYRQRFPN
jgi:hypothetical protein